LNYNVDPELLPIALFQHSIPTQALTVLLSNKPLLFELTSLLINPDFQARLEQNQINQSIEYFPETKSEIESIVAKWISLLDEKQISDKTTLNLLLEKFFNLDGKTHPGSTSGCTTTLESWRNLCSTTYLLHNSEHKDYDYRPPTFKSITNSLLPLNYLKRYSISMERAEYLLDLDQRIESFLSTHFPQIHTYRPETLIALRNPKNTESFKATQALNEANGSWSNETKEIVISSATQVEATTSEDLSKEMTFTFGPDLNKSQVSRKVSDTITLIHEKIHGDYNLLVQKDMNENPEGEFQTADFALNEGLAVLVEMLAIDLLVQDPQILGLTQQEVDELRNCLDNRINTFKGDDDPYNQGLRIMRTIFEEAAKQSGNPSRKNGIDGVAQFLAQIDFKKSSKINRKSPEFLQVLAKSDTKLLLSLLSSTTQDISPNLAN
jgi:hypothetical protein